MAPKITITERVGAWKISVDGQDVATPRRALELVEGSYPPVLYFPREQFDMRFFEDSQKTTHCPFKGDAGYFHLICGTERLEDAVWTYTAPKEGVEAIKDCLAFYPSVSVSEQ